MKNIKEWLDGENEFLDNEIEPYPTRKKHKHLDKNRMSRSITGHERKKIVHNVVSGLTITHVVLAILTFIVYITILISFTSFLAKFGEVNITWNSISRYYIDNSLLDTKAINSVTGMILDYRAFDTLGESFVLFSAVTCVFVLLQGLGLNKNVNDNNGKVFIVNKDPIVRYAAIILIPLIFIFGIYVIINGHISPGGGFSGGAIIGAGMILLSLAFGDALASKFFNIKTFKVITSIALLGYAITKCYSFFMGGMEFHDPIANWFHSFANGSIISGGYILILNICVGLVVACTMYGFYSLFKKGEI